MPERPASEPVRAKSAIQPASGKKGRKGGGGGAAAAGGAVAEEKKAGPGLDFAGMRAFLVALEAAAAGGRAGKLNYSLAAGADLTVKHDELLGAGAHHRDRGLTLKQLKEDIENKLAQHGQPLK